MREAASRGLAAEGGAYLGELCSGSSGPTRPGSRSSTSRSCRSCAMAGYQHVRPFGLDGGHLRLDREAPYRGDRPHANAELSFCTAEEAARTTYLWGTVVV